MRTVDKLPFEEVDQALRLMSAMAPPGPHTHDVAGVVASGLCSLLRARACLIGEVPVDLASVKVPWRVHAEFGWRDERQRHMILSSLDDPAARNPFAVALLERAAPPITTFSRRELIDDNRWYSSRYFTLYRERAGLDDQAISLWTDLPRPGWVGAISVNRDASDPPFDTGGLALLELLHVQLAPRLLRRDADSVHVQPLHNGAAPHTPDPGEGPNGRSRPAGSGLTAAQRRVLPYLLQGHKEDKIAEMLCRSRHTVHDHAMAIYREYGVHNRVELMLRFGGGPTGPAHPGHG